MTTTASTRPGRMTADQRRDAIVAASVEAFAAGGLVGASTKAIARRAESASRTCSAVRDQEGALPRGRPAVLPTGRPRLRAAPATSRRDAGVQHRARGDGPDHRLLSNRTYLLVQLQAYAACADPDVRQAVREEFSALHRRVRDLSGASTEELHTFFAQGMLLNVAAAVEFGSAPDKHWLLENLDGAS